MWQERHLRRAVWSMATWVWGATWEFLFVWTHEGEVLQSYRGWEYGRVSNGANKSNATQSPLKSFPTLFKRLHLHMLPEGQLAGHKWWKPNYENCSGPSSGLTFTIWILLTYGLTVNLNWSNPRPPFGDLVNVLLTFTRNYFRGNLES